MMARIARRSLRIQALPLFSLGKPWQSVCDAGGILALRLFEPRYVELARRVFPPTGPGKFGYAEVYPPRPGGAGVLAQVEEFRWSTTGAAAGGNGTSQAALLSARGARRFRILAVSEEEVVPTKPPLYVAHVQLLEDRDTSRGPLAEAWDYWSRPIPTPAGVVAEEDLPGQGQQRAKTVKAGTALVARLGAPVFESPESWNVVAQVPVGVAVVAAGIPRVVEGYLMVPIVPSGAVELTLFRELTSGGEDDVPTERELRATLLNLGRVPEELRKAVSGEDPDGDSERVSGRKRRSRRRG